MNIVVSVYYTILHKARCRADRNPVTACVIIFLVIIRLEPYIITQNRMLYNTYETRVDIVHVWPLVPATGYLVL